MPGFYDRRIPEVTVMAVPVVDADLCTGCGLCVDVASKTFEMNDEGICEVIDPQGDDKETIQEAIDTCPTEAISWSE